MKTPVKKDNLFKQSPDRYSVETLRERLKTDPRAALAVLRLAGADADLIETTEKAGRESSTGKPCPICGGRDRFKIVRPKDGAGSWAGYCRKCDGGRVYSPIDLYITATGLDLNAAVREIVNALDGAPPTPNGYPARKNSAMTMRKNDVVIQSATGTRARIAPTTLEKESKHGRRVMPEHAVEKRVFNHIYRDGNGAEVFNAQRVEFFDPSTGERVAIDRNGAPLEKTLVSLIPNGRGGWILSKGLDRANVPPYNFPELLAPECARVFIVEGEKAADALGRALADMGGESVATTTGAASNAGSWTKWAPECLTGKAVFILADNDGPGRRAAQTAAEAAARVACGVALVYFGETPTGEPAPTGYDVADFLDDLAASAPELEPLEQITARAVTFIPSAPVPPLQGENAEAAPEIDPEEQRNRDAIAARIEREKEQTTERILDEIALAGVDPFPVDDLPFCLFGYCAQLSKKFHLPIESTALGALAIVGTFAGYKFHLNSPEIGYSELFPKTCLLGVAKSGSFKTPLFDFLTDPIKNIENRGKRIYQDDLKATQNLQNEIRLAKAELKKTDAKIRRRKASGNADDLDDLEQRARQLENIIDQEESPEAQTPPPPALYILKPKSPEGIKRTICQNLKTGYLNGAIIGTSEGISIFNMAGGADRLLDRIAQLSEIVDGDEFNEITITSHGVGEEYLPGKKFAGALLYIQPRPFARCLKNEDIRTQGFINRLVKVYIPHSRNVATLEPITDAARATYQNLFEWLEDTEGGVFTLDPSAISLFQEWRVENQDSKNAAEDRGDDDEKAFLNKLEQVCLCYVQSLRICDFFDGKTDAQVTDENGLLCVNLKIDAMTMRRALSIAKAAAKITAACARFLARELEREQDAAPRYIARQSELERRALDLIAEEGTEGATIKRLQERTNAFRGERGRAIAQTVLDKLRNAGEIEKHGARYYVATMPETDIDGGAE